MTTYPLSVVYRVDDADAGCKVPHDFARSKLSPRGKVVALYLASRHDGWLTSRKRIGIELGMDRGAVSAGVLDLIEAAVLRIEGEVWHLDLSALGTGVP